MLRDCGTCAVGNGAATGHGEAAVTGPACDGAPLMEGARADVPRGGRVTLPGGSVCTACPAAAAAVEAMGAVSGVAPPAKAPAEQDEHLPSSKPIRISSAGRSFCAASPHAPQVVHPSNARSGPLEMHAWQPREDPQVMGWKLKQYLLLAETATRSAWTCAELSLRGRCVPGMHGHTQKLSLPTYASGETVETTRKCTNNTEVHYHV